MEFTEKKIFVTGASRGIDKSIAQHFKDLGAYVIGTKRNSASPSHDFCDEWICADFINKEDIIFSNYRGHAHYLAREGNLDQMWAELYGKVDGSSRGKAGSMHLSDWSVNFMTTSAIVTSAIPEAVGYAYAQKYNNNEGVVICYHGDGATDEGVFW